MKKAINNSSIQDCLGKGFFMTFDNGWSISVQWGTMNYCDNRDLRGFESSNYIELDPNAKHSCGEVKKWDTQEIIAGDKGSTTAEILVRDNHGMCGDVEGYLSMKEVLAAMVATEAGVYPMPTMERFPYIG
jgi:hypothetical protein|tara:strand:+ start:3242 stop:3634 length:393 start_codon:yes stop_codon:yes gene_type:complete